MRRLLLFFAALHVALCSCPKGLELVQDGDCRGFYSAVNLGTNAAMYYIADVCNGIGADPLIIHTDDAQVYWKKKYVSSRYLVIGLVCDTSSKKWMWADGSSVDYKPPSYDQKLLQDCSTGCSWYILSDGKWASSCDMITITVNIYCTKQLLQPTPSADDCESVEDDSGVCYQVTDPSENLLESQINCHNWGADLASIHSQQENSFIRRLAVSDGAVNGLIIGAVHAGKGKKYRWIDGTEWDYNNTYPGFPTDGLGDCLTMDTLSTAGQWMPIDCSTKMPVACGRRLQTDPSCPSGPWEEGQVIVSPGYPFNSSIPCNYFLSVDADKKVEVQVHVLEANSCCDRLILTDTYVGGNTIANLTGEITSKTYTSDTNFMRVTWQPNGGVNVRGMMLSFRGV